MTLDNFLEYVKTRKALDTEDIHRFMDEMSNEARRITFKLNASFHAPDEVRALLSELFGKPVPPSLRVFPPFYTDFGKNIEIGHDVFINKNIVIAESDENNDIKVYWDKIYLPAGAIVVVRRI